MSEEFYKLTVWLVLLAAGGNQFADMPGLGSMSEQTLQQDHSHMIGEVVCWQRGNDLTKFGGLGGFEMTTRLRSLCNDLVGIRAIHDCQLCD